MASTITSAFIHAEEVGVGPATVVDDDGMTPGMAFVIKGEDNETGEDVDVTFVLPMSAVHRMYWTLRERVGAGAEQT